MLFRLWSEWQTPDVWLAFFILLAGKEGSQSTISMRKYQLKMTQELYLGILLHISFCCPLKKTMGRYLNRSQNGTG